MNRLLISSLAVLLAITGFASLAYADNAVSADLPQGLVLSASTVYDNPASYRLNAENPVTDISIHYYLNGQVYQIKPLFRKDGRIFIPLRVAGEAFGRVDWDNAKKQATITDSSNTVLVTLNSTTILVNSQTRQMDVAPILIDDTVYLPFRVIGEALNKYVDYFERHPSNYYIVMTETKEDCQSIESDQQFAKVYSMLIKAIAPNSTLLAYSRNYTIFKNNETNEYMLDGFIRLSEVMGGRWLVDDLHIKGLEGDTTKYWACFSATPGSKYLLAAFYPDGSVRIISDSLDDGMNFLQAKDGYLYFTNVGVENDYFLKRINLKTPKGQPFKIENLGEKGYLYGYVLGFHIFTVENLNPVLSPVQDTIDFREDGIYAYGLTLSDFNKAQQENNPSLDLYPSYAMYKIFYDGSGQEKVGEGKINTINTNTQ